MGKRVFKTLIVRLHRTVTPKKWKTSVENSTYAPDYLVSWRIFKLQFRKAECRQSLRDMLSRGDRAENLGRPRCEKVEYWRREEHDHYDYPH